MLTNVRKLLQCVLLIPLLTLLTLILGTDVSTVDFFTKPFGT